MEAPRLPPGHLRRDRVAALIEDAARAELVVVRAPAGSGKSTALAAWAAGQPEGSVAWVNAGSRGDGWACVARSLDLAIGPDRGATPAVIAAALNGRRGATTVVIDDFPQTGISDEELVWFVSKLVRGRVLVAGRSSELLPSALHGVRVHIAAITAEDLGFTVEEIETLLTAEGLPLDRAQDVHDRTGGHALLTRLVLPMDPQTQRQPECEAVAGLVLSLIDPQLANFALRVAMARAVDGEMARWLDDTGGTDLSALVGDGLGTLDELGFFRFHGIIGDALRVCATRHFDLATRQTLVARAAAYLDGRGVDPMTVLALLAESGQSSKLWPLCARNFWYLMDNPRSLLAAIDQMSDDAASDATLGALRVTVRGLTEPDASMDLQDSADLALEELSNDIDGESPEETFYRLTLIFGVLRAASRFEEAASFADKLETLANSLDPATRLRLGPVRRAASLAAAATHTLTGNLAGAERVLVQLSPGGEGESSHRGQILWSLIHALTGRIRSAAEILDTIADPPPNPQAWAARLSLARSAVALERGDPGAARELIRDIQPNLAVVQDWPAVLALLARISITTDPRAGLEELEGLLRRHGHRRVAPLAKAQLHCALADLAIAAGELPRARRLIAGGRGHETGTRLTAGTLALITGEDRPMRELVAMVQNGGMWPLQRAQALLILAVDVYRKGPPEPAKELLCKALAITEEHQIRSVFSLVPRSDLDGLSAATGLRLPPNINEANPLEAVLSRISLTPRERALLGALAGPSRLQEIASSHFVSLSTIKSQAQSLYRKLGVHSRSEAVESARWRGLLPAPEHASTPSGSPDGVPQRAAVRHQPSATQHWGR